MFDKMISVTRFKKRTDTKLKTEQMLWSYFTSLFSSPVEVGIHTLPEYLELEKEVQGYLKDRGGYVGGVYNTTDRSSGIKFMDVGALDCDRVPAEGLPALIEAVKALGVAFVLHTTRKHSQYTPKVRVWLLFSRSVNKTEYEPIMRKMAEKVGIETVDSKSFSPKQFMYSPTKCKDAEFVHDIGMGEALDVDAVLAEYTDWHNRLEWAYSIRDNQRVTRAYGEHFMQHTPENKRGKIGAFCREYNCVTFAEEFLPHLYRASETDPNRFDWISGESTNGVQVFDGGSFFFSHHETDPTCEILVNAYDLGRRHLFPNMTEKQSCTMMDEFIMNIPKVKARYDEEWALDKVRGGGSEADRKITAEVIKKLEKAGDPPKVIKSIENVYRILKLDPRLEGVLQCDSMSMRFNVVEKPPWLEEDTEFKAGLWTDNDEYGLTWLLQKYTNFSKDTINAGLGKYFMNNMVNPLKLYITDPSTPPWDGTPRVDTFFTDYLGAENSHYTRRAARMWFCGAIYRALNAGSKFDLIPVLSGKPGNGKTEICILLGANWSLDKLSDITGVKAMENIGGKWIVVLDESAYKAGACNEIAKAFLTSKTDNRRVPYGKYTQDFPRTCVFIATTNKKAFLNDPTGDRRFIPIVNDVVPHTKDYRDLTPKVVLQLWKEAKVMSDAGEKTWINDGDEDWAIFFGKQEEHREISQVETEILNFLEHKITDNWSTKTLDERMAFYAGTVADNPRPTLVERTEVCPREILLECFRLDTTKWSGKQTAEIRDVMDNLRGWEKVQGQSKRFGIHGIANPWYKKVTL